MWVKDKGSGGAEEESQDPSCMIGVSGRFLCDIQVEARSQRSTDATQTPYHNLCAYTPLNMTSFFKKKIKKGCFLLLYLPDDEVELRASEH